MAYQRVSETLNLTSALDLATLTTVKGPKGGRQDKPKRYFPRRLSNLTVEMSSGWHLGNVKEHLLVMNSIKKSKMMGGSGKSSVFVFFARYSR